LPFVTGQFSDTKPPSILLRVGVSPERRSALERVGFPVPEPVLVSALLDTGANLQAFDPDLFKQLDLTAISRERYFTSSTSSGEPEESDTYEVFIQVIMGNHIHDVGTFSAFAMSNWQDFEGYHSLVGRGFLANFLLVCDGPKSAFTLSVG
jgi:hypothetical protein